jgi:sugar transferase (PEP-CTERM/EpsH1 system associated)
MNILFLAQRVPYPPNKGDKLRSFNEIKFLSQRHKISLVCLADNEKELQYESELKQYCHSVDIVFLPSYRSKIRSLLYMFSNVPLTLPYFYSKELQSIIHRKLQENTYDLIFAYCSSMAQYVEHVQHIPKVIDFVDVDSEKWAQYAFHAKFPYMYIYRRESKRLRKYEALIARTFQYCFFVSEKEVEDFQKLGYPCSTITPISNGVDTDMFQPSRELYNPNSLVFTGAMDYFANVEAMLYFSREILPLIQKAIPDVKLYIVGSNPSTEIRRLGENHQNIFVTGYVDQVQPYVQKSAVFVAPMRIARGLQNKILEAMAMGVPVVTTSLGFEGITAVPGKDIFVEDQPDHFAKQVIRLMTDPELRKTVSSNARRVIEENYNWEKNLEKLENILLEIVKK